jgi:Tol biopolymer transport system component
VAPDGRIAFGRFGAGGITSQVYVMGAAGAGVHPITPPAVLAVPGEWTPDSRQLVINSNAFGFQGSRLNAAIYRVRPDGSGLRRLTRPSWPNNDILASPSPAGNRVVFVSDRRYPDLCCNDLYVMRSDGNGLHRVPTGDLNGVGNPDWGSARRDAGTGAATVATSQRARPGRVQRLGGPAVRRPQSGRRLPLLRRAHICAGEAAGRSALTTAVG